MVKINLSASFFQLIMKSMRLEGPFQQGDETNYANCIQKIKWAIIHTTVLNNKP